MDTELFRKSKPKTSQTNWQYGEDTSAMSTRFWTPFDSSYLATLRILKRYVSAESKFLEIGFAPGKLLAWVSLYLNANVTGLDYSESGCNKARVFFKKIGALAEIKCENVFDNSLSPNSFDVVFSRGVIEHFDEPEHIVQKHLELTKFGGLVILLIPNYGGIWKLIQEKLDPDNLSIHNLDIMNPKSVELLFDKNKCEIVDSGFLGPITLSHLSLSRVIPKSISTVVTRTVDLFSTFIPLPVGKFAPQIFVVARKISN